MMLTLKVSRDDLVSNEITVSYTISKPEIILHSKPFIGKKAELMASGHLRIDTSALRIIYHRVIEAFLQ